MTSESAQLRTAKLVKIMSGVVILVLAVSQILFSWQTYRCYQERLSDEVEDLTGIIEAVARFDADNSRFDHPGGNIGATLSQIIDAFGRIQHGDGSEIVLAERRGERIFFILAVYGDEFVGMRHQQSHYHLARDEYSTELSSHSAIPMKNALAGGRGVILAPDYRDSWVLAAYAPIELDGHLFGIVAKMDVKKIWLPILSFTLFSLVLGFVLIKMGASRFMNLINPLIRRLKEEVSANQAMINTSPSAILIVSGDGKILNCNPAAEKLFGFAAAEMLGQHLAMLMAEGVAAKHVIAFQRFVSTPERHNHGIQAEVVASHKDGRAIPLQLSIGTVQRGEGIQLVGILTDLTERKAAEAELRGHRDRMAQLAETVSHEADAIIQTAVSGIVTIDTQGIIQVFNLAAEKLFGWRADEVIGKNVRILMDEPIASAHDGYLRNYLKTRQGKIIGVGREVMARRKDGSLFHAHLAVGHAELEEGRHFMVGFITDITRQKEHEAQLWQAKEAAEAGNRAKANFIANMSHEIRTPMNAILGFSELLLKEPLQNETAHDHLKVIHGAANSLLSILNDILDASKLESGKFTLERVCFHLPNMLNDMLSLMASRSENKNLALRLNYDAGLPARVIGDPTRLRQVLVNLVGNAIKFTKRGRVLIKVAPTAALDMISISVIDTGIGMTPEQTAHIFEPFSQADNSITRRYGGTGLGTAIAKQIVELMGGEIWVESRLGEGSNFHFTVHLPESGVNSVCLFEEDYQRQAQYVSPRLFRVLLAEDQEVNAKLAILRLERQGHQVDWVKNGREAVEAYNKVAYDLILMDMMMPELDGLGATRQIRAMENANEEHIPILALTASVTLSEQEKYEQAGMDGLEGKPVNFDHLFETMEKLVPSHKGKPNPALAKQVLAVVVERDDDSVSLDYAKGLQIWQDEKIYTSALKRFASDHGLDAKVADRLLAQGQTGLAEAKALAHTLKGVAANLALPQVAALAAQLNTDLNAGLIEQARQRLVDLERALVAAISDIDRLKPQDESCVASAQVIDPEIIRPLLESLITGLTTANPEIVEPILAELANKLPEHLLRMIRDDLAAFEFEAAQAKVQAVLDELNAG